MKDPKRLMALAMLAAAMAVPGLAQTSLRVMPSIRRFQGNSSGKKYRANGKRECARRRRQIKRFQLNRENGLWISAA